MIRRLKQLVSFVKPGWSGNHKSWAEAEAKCSNYAERTILDKVSAALLEVKKGKAAFERDSVLFYKPEYNWPLLTALLYGFAKSNKQLTVIDFGGSLGSTYFQHRIWLDSFRYSWNVVEQPHFVEEGKKNFQDDALKFFNSVEEVPAQGPVFLILSSVLAYLPEPYASLDKLLSMNFEFVFIDRTPLVPGPNRLTVQNVPKEIYDASYPAWFFNKEEFTGHMLEKYRIIAENDCREKADFQSEFLGFFLTLKK